VTSLLLAEAKQVHHLDEWDIALLLILPVLVIGLSRWLRLGVIRDVSIGTLRCIGQLVAVGLVISWIFARSQWYWVLLALTVMITVAGLTAARNAKVKVPGLGPAITGILAICTGITLIYVGEAIVGVEGWDARYLIPLGGMLLGNAMTAATLATERFVSDIRQSRLEVESWLALGASPRRATDRPLRAAIRAAMTPTINVLMVVGIVKLPGMMTGQILGGSPPIQAAMYQILIMLGILFTDCLAATLTLLFVYRRLFTKRWQLGRAMLDGGK
jgi:putative ABC transport system permease protein